MQKLLSIIFVLLGALLLPPSNAAAPAVPAATAPPPFAQLDTAASVTKCKLQLEGLGSVPGIKSASLECTGATLTATAAPQLLTALDPQARGIKWSPSCSSENRCLLTICDSSVTFNAPMIQTVNVTGSRTTALVCIGDNSNVAMQNGVFSNWHSMDEDKLVAVNVTSSSASLVLSNTAFLRDKQEWGEGPYGGALMAVAGQTTVLSSTFEGCHTQRGGAIVASGKAKVDIGTDLTGAPTTFDRSIAEEQGGDISVSGTARVRVYGAVLTKAEAAFAGSIDMSGSCTVEIVDTTISNASALCIAGGINVANSAELKMVRSSVTGCKAVRAVGAISVSGDAVATLTNSTISNNVAGSRTSNTRGIASGASGGIGTGESARLTLQDTLITGNTAAFGGGMVINPYTQLLVLGNTKVSGNEAWEAGGGVQFLTTSLTGSFDDLERATYDNTAPEDADISLPANQLLVLGATSSSGNSTTASFLPGDTLLVNVSISGANGSRSNQTVTVALQTPRNAAWTTLYTDKLHVEAGSRRQATAQARVMIRQPPGKYRLYLFTDNPLLANDAKVATLNLTVVDCPLGYATASRDSCLPCVQGYYSFKPAAKECSWCPERANCSGIHSGLPQVWPEQGWWHSAPNSIHMHRCLNPKACSPSVIPTRQAADDMSVPDYKTSQCSPEYQGNLCGDCRMPNYGKIRPFVCRKCMSRPVIISLYVLAACAMMGLIKLMLYFEQKSNRMSRQSLDEILPEDLLKVMVLHGQWLYIISYLVGVPWPATLAVPIQILTGLWSSTSGSSIGFECVLQADRIPLGIQKELLCLLTPLAIMCVIVLYEVVVHYVDPTQNAKAQDKLFSLTMCVVFMFLPTWLNSVFSLFTCVKLDKSGDPAAQAIGSFFVNDMSQQCYKGYHNVWSLGLGVPLLLLLCVFLPAAVFIFMWRSRKADLLDEPTFVQHYGFMYRLWREGVCWWEAVVIFQTTGLVLVATFGFSLGPYRQSLATCAVLGVVIVLLLWVRPFACRPVNHYAVASACVLFVTAYSALTFLPYDGDPANPGYSNAMGVAVLIANFGFLLVAGWKLVYAVDWDWVNRNVMRAINRVSGKQFMHPGASSQLSSGQSGDCESAGHAPTLYTR